MLASNIGDAGHHNGRGREYDSDARRQQRAGVLFHAAVFKMKRTIVVGTNLHPTPETRKKNHTVLATARTIPASDYSAF